MIKRLIIAIFLLALVGGSLVMFNLFRARMIGAFFASMPEQVMPVTTITVARTDWQPELAAIGTVKAAQGVDLTVEGAGIVRSVEFSANENVVAGQTLLTLDDETQRADLEAARTQAALAQTNLERARRLQARGVTADANLDTTASNARAAAAQVARAEAVLKTRTLVAPFSGTIGLPQVDPGSYIAPGAVVATLQDLDRMRVDFSLPEQDLENLHIGQAIRVMVDVSEDSRGFAGTVTGIDPKVDAASRMLKLRGALEDAGGGALTPGQFVRVAVALPREAGVLALPQTAVMSSLYGDFVYVVRERAPTPPAPARDPAEMDLLDRLVARVMAGNGPAGGGAGAGDGAGDGASDGQAAPPPEAILEVVQVFVQTGRRSGGMVEVTGGTVAPGDQVVSSGQNRLSNGQRVRVDNSVTPDGNGEAAAAGIVQGAAEAAGADAGSATATGTGTGAGQGAAEAGAGTQSDGAAGTQSDGAAGK